MSFNNDFHNDVEEVDNVSVINVMKFQRKYRRIFIESADKIAMESMEMTDCHSSNSIETCGVETIVETVVDTNASESDIRGNGYTFDELNRISLTKVFFSYGIIVRDFSVRTSTQRWICGFDS